MSILAFRRAPTAVRQVLLPPGDRRLAWSLTAEGAPLVASAYGLTLPGRVLLDWHLVEKATWQRPHLTVHEVGQPLEPAPATSVREGTGTSTTLTLVAGGNLPEVVRARVTASVVWSRHLQLAAGGLRVVGRRQRGGAGLTWQLVFDPGTDVADPRVRSAAEDALAAARRAIA